MPILNNFSSEDSRVITLRLFTTHMVMSYPGGSLTTRQGVGRRDAQAKCEYLYLELAESMRFQILYVLAEV